MATSQSANAASAGIVAGGSAAAGGTGTSASEEKLNHIRSSLARADALTQQMCGMLDSFEDRLAGLSEAMAPIHNVTTNLTRAHENVGETLVTIGTVMENLAVADDVGARIYEGPQGDMESYLDYVDQVAKAQRFLRNEGRLFKSSDKALSQLKSLAGKALPELEDEFSALVTRPRPALSPSTILDPLPQKVELYLPPARDAMVAIGARLVEFDRLGFLRIFRETRAKCLQQTLGAFLSDQRAIVPSVALQPVESEGASGASALKPQTSSPNRPGVTTGSKRKGRYVQGSHPFIRAMAVFVLLLRAERQLALDVAGEANFSPTFTEIVAHALDDFVQAGVGAAKKKRTTDRVFVLLDLLSSVNVQIDQFNVVLGGLADSKPLERVSTLTWDVTVDAKKALKELEDAVRAHSPKNVPADGTVHEITSNTLQFLRRLLDYAPVLESILPPPPADGRASSAMAAYVQGVLGALFQNIERKQRAFKSEPLGWVFVLNNMQHTRKAVEADTLRPLVGNVVIRSLQDRMEAAHGEYMRRSWMRACSFLQDDGPEAAGVARGGPLSNAERALIKKRFAGFNSAFGDLYHAQRSFSIPDASLRARLRQDSIALVVPLYQAFYTKFDVAFTKNRGKYVRYPVATLESMLQKMFE